MNKLKKPLRRWLAAMMAATFIVPSVPAEVSGLTGDTVMAAEDTQIIASPEETVYINSYGGTERTRDFTSRWKFKFGEQQGADNKVYDDSEWSTINLPHDYSIEQSYTTAGEAESAYLLGGIGWYRKNFTVDPAWEGKRITIEFDGVYMDSTVYFNGVELGGHPYGYTPFSFELPQELIDFQGDNVIAVRVNHETPSSRWYSGSGIYREVKLTVTDRVHVDRYGITITTPNLASSNGTDGTVEVKTTVANNGGSEVSGLRAEYTIKKVGSEEAVGTQTQEFDAIVKDATQTKTTNISVSSFELWNSWDQGDQNQYVLVTEIKNQEGTTIDKVETLFGFRYFNFDRNTGFSLNGKNMKLKGVCMHHDQGALGAEAWEDAIRRQVQILKDMGCNSIRVTHNPAAEILVEICNEEGMLLIDESFDGWSNMKNENNKDYARFFKQEISAENGILGKEEGMTWAEYDIKAMVARGVNAPAIIAWSLGNEIIEGSTGPDYPQTALSLIEWVKDIDTTREITFGDNRIKGGGNAALMEQVADNITAAGGIVGYNYADWSTAVNRHSSRNWTAYFSETASHVNSRGVYEYTGNGGTGNVRGADGSVLLSSYDNQKVGWGKLTSEAWWEVVRFDANAGHYVWTGFDYIGEPTPMNGTGQGQSPYYSGSFDKAPKSSYFGIVDLAGFPKDNYYLYRSIWNETDTTLHVLPTWDAADLPNNGAGNINVVVYSNAPKVELRLNGETIGTQEKVTRKSVSGWTADDSAQNGLYEYQVVSGKSGHKSLYHEFSVPYQPGTLEAIAYDSNDQVITSTVGRSKVVTTDGAKKLALSVDQKEITANEKDLSYVTIDVQDNNGNFVNSGEPEISLEITGPGRIIGVENGNQSDHTSPQSTVRKAHRGKLVAVVQAGNTAGTITVTAKADGLTTGQVEIKVNKEVQEGTEEKTLESILMSRMYYVPLNATVELPTQLQVNYTDGSNEKLPVVWNTEALSTEEMGTKTVSGMINGNIPVIVYVNVIDEVAALLNYSTYLRVGEELKLPNRPAVMKDGQILDAYFPVEWDTEGIDFSKPGTYLVEGEATVFGQSLKPTASVRVTKGEIIPGENVAPTAAKLETNATVETSAEIVRDGNKSATDDQWVGKGEILFGWDTAQNVNKVVLYLADTAPNSDGMSVMTSGDKVYWQQEEFTVENKKQQGMTVRTFNFSMSNPVWLKLAFEENVKLIEAEFYGGTPNFPVGTSAALEELEVGGILADDSSLARKHFGVENEEITLSDIKAKGKDNASVTVLPKNDKNEFLILTMSEDGKKQEQYVVKLGEAAIGGIDATDNSNDYDFNLIVATAVSQQSEEQSPSKVTDGNEDTMWHSQWSNSYKLSDEDRYIQLEIKQRTEGGSLETLSEPVEVSAVRYLPRPTGPNGTVIDYNVKYSVDGDTWIDVPGGSGTGWATDSNWKIVNFAPVQARFIRLYGVSTGSDSNQPNWWMSAREIRLCSPQKDFLSSVNVELPTTEFNYTGSAIEAEVKVTTKDGTLLQAGRDYNLVYNNNTEPGQATVYVKGAGVYRGTLRYTYTIKEADIRIESLEEINIVVAAGVEPVLPGTIVANLTGGSKKDLEVAWPAIDPQYYAQPGEFLVKGVSLETNLVPAARIQVVGDKEIVGIEGISLVTAPGIEPELPSSVTIIYSNGDKEEKAVTQWTEPENWNNTAGDIITVEGTVEGTTLKAKASIRFVAASDGNNFALNTSGSGRPLAIAYYSTGSDNPKNANNGNKNFVTDGNKVIWCEWERDTFHYDMETNWWGVIFEEEKLVNEVRIGFTQEDQGNSSSKVSLPADYQVQYYVGPDFTVNESNNGMVKDWTDSPLLDADNWKTVTYTNEGGKPAVPSAENNAFKALVPVTIDTVATKIIRIQLQPQQEQWVGLEEVEVYGYDATRNSDFEVTSITLGETDITTDLTTNLTYTRELGESEAIPQVEVVVTNNANVTITEAKRAGESTTITIVPENGDTTKAVVYTITFTGESEVPVIQLESTVTAINITPSEGLIVHLGNEQQFTATVSGNGKFNKNVRWEISGNESDATTIGSTTGLLAVGPQETAESITVKAVSVGNSEVTKEVTVTIGTDTVGIKSVTVHPTLEDATIARRGEEVQFNAEVRYIGILDNSVKWSVSGNSSAETVIGEDSGLLTIGSDEASEILTVKATSVADDTKSDTSIVKVRENMQVIPLTGPTNLSATAKNATTATFSFSAAQGTEGVITYNITVVEKASNTRVTTTSGTQLSYNLNGLENGKTYIIKVEASAEGALGEIQTLEYTHKYKDGSSQLQTPEGIWLYNVNDSLVYNGAKQTQSFKLFDGDTLLEEKKDYTVTYKNNTNAYLFEKANSAIEEDVNLGYTLQSIENVSISGTLDEVTATVEANKITADMKKKAPQMIIKLKGNYKGTITVYFEIQPLSFGSEDAANNEITADHITVVYNKKEQKPKPVVLWKGKKLAAKDFTVEPKGEYNYTGKATEATINTLELKGQGNFTGTREIMYMILPGAAGGVEMIPASKLSVSNVKALTFNQTAADSDTGMVQEKLVVKYGKKALEPIDYVVKYENNDKVGTATLLIMGNETDDDKDGKCFVGVKRLTFKINGNSMSKVKVEGLESYTYTGNPITPLVAGETGKVQVTLNGKPVDPEAYEIDYQNNTNKGTATLILTGNEEKGFTGVKKQTFKIVSDTIVKGQDKFAVTIIDEAQTAGAVEEEVQMPFTKGGVKPAIEVTDSDGKVLKADVDYTVSYKNNTKLAKYSDGKKAPAVVVKGKGNYAGKVEVPFTIIQKDVEVEVNADDITVVAADKVESFKNKGWKSTVKVLDQSGKALAASDAQLKDATYTIEELPASSEGIDNYAELEGYKANETNIPDGAKIPAGTTVKITVALKGDFYKGTVSGTYRILEDGKDISKFTFKIKDQAYTGDEIEIDETSDFATIQYKKQNVVLVMEDGTEHSLEVVPGSYVKNVNKGTAKVTLQGVGEYGGTKTVSFKIVERNVKDNNNFNAIFKGLIDIFAE